MDSTPQSSSISASGAFRTTGRSRKGEPWVWLTAAGLTLGIAMAIGLLLLIMFKGLHSFWPQPIDLMEIKRDGEVQVVRVQRVHRRGHRGPDHDRGEGIGQQREAVVAPAGGHERQY